MASVGRKEDILLAMSFLNNIINIGAINKNIKGKDNNPADIWFFAINPTKAPKKITAIPTSNVTPC